MDTDDPSTVHNILAPPAISGRRLVKNYGPHRALAGVDIDVRRGEAVAIVGPSGSGKSTLLHVLAGIVPADSGEVLLAGSRIDGLSETRRSLLRRSEFGFVFQNGLLVAELSAEENVALPMLLGGAERAKATAAARHWLDRLGLSGRYDSRPGQLSGGQAQRVAIARALAHRPSVVFADEPTGQLDSRTGVEIMDVLLEICAETNAAVLIVTHDLDLAARATRSVRIRDGLIESTVLTA